VLTRIERRVLNLLLQNYPLEQWTVLSPMIGFIQALGAVNPKDPMYTWIVPKLPELSFSNGTSPNCALQGLRNIDGISRVPVMPALREFIRRFGNNTTTSSDGYIFPAAYPTDASPFLSLHPGGNTGNDWNTFRSSPAWIAPAETGNLITMTDLGLKKSMIRRWRVPEHSETSNLTGLQNFLGLPDDQPLNWIRNPIRMMSALTKFFPGSVNLSEISPTTSLNSIGRTLIVRSIQKPAKDNAWYRGRSLLSVSVSSPGGYADIQSLKISASTMWNADLDTSVLPTAGTKTEPSRTGPFFENRANEPDSVPVTQFESGFHSDPAIRFSELIESNLFDRNGGR